MSLQRKIPNLWLPKAALLILILFVQGYTIEHLLFGDRFNLSYPLGVLAVGTALLTVHQWMRIRPIAPIDIMIVLFGCAVIFSTLVNNTGYEFALRVLFGSIGPYYVARLCILRNEELDHVVRNTVLIVAVAVAGAYLWVFATSPEPVWRLRLGGANPIAVGEVIGFGSVAALICATRNTCRARWMYMLTASFCLAIQVVVLGTRGSVFAAILAFCLAAAVSGHMRRAAGVLVIVVCVAAIGVGLYGIDGGAAGRFLPSSISTDPSVVGSREFTGRLENWSDSMGSMMERPFIGIGLGEIYSHNIFLEVGSGMGLIGLFAFLIVLASVPWRRIMRLAHRDPAVMSILALFLFALIYRNASFNLTMHKSLFVYLGLLVAMSQNLYGRTRGTTNGPINW